MQNSVFGLSSEIILVSYLPGFNQCLQLENEVI